MEGDAFNLSILSTGGARLLHLTDEPSSIKTRVLGRVSLRGGLSRKDPFLSRNHARVQIERVGGESVAKFVPIHQNPCYVVRKDRENVVEEFWDAEEACELINERSDGSRDEIILHDGDEIRFSKEGDKFAFRVERSRGSNGETRDETARTTSVEKENGGIANRRDRTAEAAADTLPLGGGDEAGDDDEAGGDADVDDDSTERREITNDDRSIVDERRRKTLFSTKPAVPSIEGDDDASRALSTARSTRETESSPPSSTVGTDSKKLVVSGNASSSTSRRRERRLPAWWTDMVRDVGDGGVQKAATKRKRKARAEEDEKSFLASDQENDDVDTKDPMARPNVVGGMASHGIRIVRNKNPGDSPGNDNDDDVGDERRRKLSPTKEKMDSSGGNGLKAREEAKPNRRVESSANESKRDDRRSGEIVTNGDASTNVPSVPPRDGRIAVASNVAPNLAPSEREKRTEKPSSSMFSRENFGTLSNVLDDSDEEVNERTDRRLAGAPSSTDITHSTREGDPISDVDEEGEKGGVSDKTHAKADDLSDRDSWEEITPPTSPLRNSVRNSTPKKVKAETSTTAASSTSSTRRDKCQYGKDCYRKNPAHFKECSHPGDADWVEDDKEEEEEQDGESQSQKPWCEYGADCYRKNPQHRREYRHPKPGDRPSRKAAIKAKNKTKKRKKPDEDDDDDEDDEYESSFVNDDSDLDPDETFDSSSDSSDGDGGDDDEDDDFKIDDDDVEEEDERQLKRLKKEAKRFAKK